MHMCFWANHALLLGGFKRQFKQIQVHLLFTDSLHGNKLCWDPCDSQSNQNFIFMGPLILWRSNIRIGFIQCGIVVQQWKWRAVEYELSLKFHKERTHEAPEHLNYSQIQKVQFCGRRFGKTRTSSPVGVYSMDVNGGNIKAHCMASMSGLIVRSFWFIDSEFLFCSD